MSTCDDPAQASMGNTGGAHEGRRPHVVPLAPMARKIFDKAVARRREQGTRRQGVFASRFLVAIRSPATRSPKPLGAPSCGLRPRATMPRRSRRSRRTGRRPTISADGCD